MKLLHSNPAPQVAGLDLLPTLSNYFIGSDPKRWRTNISNYARVQYEQIYPGVNLDYYGNQRQLEYDFTVTPGADPATIKLGIDGANKVEIDDQGDLVLHTTSGILRQRRPLIYQEVNGIRQEICGGYALLKTQDTGLQSQGSYLVAFRVGAYDRSRPLVIDPVLVYSTYLGGGGEEQGNAITVDAAGNAYVSGVTASTNSPTANALQPAFGGGLSDAFVTKLSPAGTQLIYSTYLGGSGTDGATSIALDTTGNVHLTGVTSSTNFPLAHPLQGTFDGGDLDAFVTKLNAVGTQLIYSTYLG